MPSEPGTVEAVHDREDADEPVGTIEPVETNEPVETIEPVDTIELSDATEPVEASDESLQVETEAEAETETEAEAEAETISFAIPGTGNVIEFPGMVRPTPPVDDNTKRIGTLEIPLPLI